ncbi:uncharacterized protein LOC133644626 [Entelurus aequoreus]|uniref:uncharacterized protein LOC133644626 n=1 Tax=Entelurus aequoreus TaxID=161455 RepID=UPI002B1E43FE|nr:uncharacterized protein LOC133644626 [Entelurus aequoreus]
MENVCREDVCRVHTAEDVCRVHAAEDDCRVHAAEDVCRVHAAEDDCRVHAAEDVCRVHAAEDVCRVHAAEDVCRVHAAEDVCRFHAAEDVCRFHAADDVCRFHAADDVSPWRHYRPPFRRPRWWPYLGRPPRRPQRHSTRRRHQTRPRWIRGHLGRRPTTSSPLRPPLTFVSVFLFVVRPVGHLEAVHKEGGTVTAQTPANASHLSVRSSERTSGHAHERAHPGARRARLRPPADASCKRSPAFSTPARNEGPALISSHNLPGGAGVVVFTLRFPCSPVIPCCSPCCSPCPPDCLLDSRPLAWTFFSDAFLSPGSPACPWTSSYLIQHFGNTHFS